VGSDRNHIDEDKLTQREFDWAEAKFQAKPRSLIDWKDLVSEEGREKIEALIKQEILKKLGS